MSAISLAWVATIKVGNQTAKQLLLFYASHNFNKPGFEFKNATLANQLEVTERAIQKAHKLLIEQKLVIREKRHDENGRELSTSTYLNIPQEFVDNFFNRHGEGERSAPLGANVGRGEGERSAPLLNNKLNNKLNKRGEEHKKRVPLSDYHPGEGMKQLLEETSRKTGNQQLLTKFKALMKKKNLLKSNDWDNELQLFLLRERPTLKPSYQETNEAYSAVNRMPFHESPWKYTS